MSFEILVWCLVAYAMGAMPSGVLVARRYGVDLISLGSGNTGATNVYRALGKGPALVVFVLDMLKSMIPALIVRGRTGSEDWALVAGICAVVGHSLSPFLGFRGGKGVSSGLGALLGSSPAVGLAVLGTFLVAFGLCSYVSLSSLVAVTAMFAFGVLFERSTPALVAYGALVAFVYSRHASNIRRLLDGTEPKFSLQGHGKDDGYDEGAPEGDSETSET